MVCNSKYNYWKKTFCCQALSSKSCCWCCFTWSSSKSCQQTFAHTCNYPIFTHFVSIGISGILSINWCLFSPTQTNISFNTGEGVRPPSCCSIFQILQIRVGGVVERGGREEHRGSYHYECFFFTRAHEWAGAARGCNGTSGARFAVRNCA